MRADLEEHRLAVRRADVLGDLDAVHLAALERRMGERDRLDELGGGGDERLHLGLVVPQVAVAGRARRQRRGRRARAEGAVGSEVGARLRDEVVDLHAVAQAGVAQLVEVRGAVGDDVGVPALGVLGEVEVQRLEQVHGGERRRAHLDHRGLLRARAGGHRLREDAELRARRRAGAPAGLHGEATRAAEEAFGDLGGAEALRRRDDAAGGAVEDRHVPVAGRRGELRADQAGGRHGQRLGGAAGRAGGEQARVAGAGDRAPRGHRRRQE
jgi:hypothetical protein